MKASDSICLENADFRLIINPDCTAGSLIFKPTGEECLFTDKKYPLFSLTEKRPFNNEIKLAYPNKRMTFSADRVRMENDCLIVGFELVRFEAVIRVKITENYMSFRLERFLVRPEHFEGLCMDVPPVEEFRLLQLPVKKRSAFGEWLGVCHDERVAVGVLATSVYERIDNVKEDAYYLLCADAVRDIRLNGCEAALIVTAKERFLDRVERLERDYGMPNGVKSRRSDATERAAYWSANVNPQNVDTHIAYMKKCGFTNLLLYYPSVFAPSTLGERGYAGLGEYRIHPHFPNGFADLKHMLEHLKAEGITTGLHVLHSHIGLRSPYLTPEADHRIHLTRHFTLSEEITSDAVEIPVEENPRGAVMHEKCRVLRFGTELIRYEGYTTEPPYRFYGCERGYNDTVRHTHERGCIGGILDLSEFGAQSAYIDQNTSLQDEIAEKIAAAYAAGFEFMYFDGSEGTNPPYEFHVSGAQYRVYKRLDREPLFCTGAAKSHFGWHMLSGGNAFDVFPPEVFKEKLAEFPAEEAERMAMDFTVVNFGWWRYFAVTEPDMFEYGMKLAAAWNCPVTMMESVADFEKNPRTEDNFEVLRRWEDFRRKKLLTDERREALKDTQKEAILLVNENGEYEITEYHRIDGAAGGDARVTAYMFERSGENYVVCWHTTGEGTLRLPLSAKKFAYRDEFGEVPLTCEEEDGLSLLPLSGRRYFSSALSAEETEALFRSAVLTDKNG